MTLLREEVSWTWSPWKWLLDGGLRLLRSGRLISRLLGRRLRLLGGLLIRFLERGLGLSSFEESQSIDIGLLLQNITMTVLKLV